MPNLRDLRTLRSLRHRNFRLLLEGALISSSGDFMQQIAQSWLVWELYPLAFLFAAAFYTRDCWWAPLAARLRIVSIDAGC